VNPSGALDTLRPGNWTEDEIQYLRQRTMSVSNFDTIGAQAFVSGPVFELPAGDLNVAFGLEHRRDTGFNKPDSITEAGESVANQVFTTDGALEVDEIFTEIDIPILNGMMIAEDLSLNLQWRYSDYDIFGSEDVYRAGLNWQITDWIRLRGNVGTAYRAPTVTNLFGGGTVSFDFFSPDICDGTASGIQPGSNAYQNCLLDGVDPATFTQPSSQYAVLSGSNPALTPETAETITYGAVFTPGGFLEGLQLSVDVWDISVEELISRNTSESVMNDCYNGPVGLTAPECANFGRNPNTGVPSNFINRLANLEAGLDTNGVDYGIAYAFEAGPTSWNLSVNGTYVDEYTAFPGAGGADDRGSVPRNQANFAADLFLNDWTFGWRTRWIGAMTDPSYDGTGTDNTFGYTGTDDYYKHDLRVAYNWNRYRFSLGVNNIADEDPPYVFASGKNTDAFLYDVIGQYWFARVTFTM
jgi:outer membrane receptor protein involved in Fe transport